MAQPTGTGSGAGAPDRIPGQISGQEPGAAKSSRKPAKGRAPVSGRPVSDPPIAPRQKQVAAGATAAAAGALNQALSSPKKAMPQTVRHEPQSPAAPARHFDPSKLGVATPFTVPKKPAKTPPPLPNAAQQATPKTPEGGSIGLTASAAPAIKVARTASNPAQAAVALGAHGAASAALKPTQEFTLEDAKILAKNYTIVGEGSSRRIVHVKDRTFTDAVKMLFQNRVNALVEFAKTNHLTRQAMQQLPGKVQALTTQLQKPEGAKHALILLNTLTANERVAVLKALPNEVIIPLYGEASTNRSEGMAIEAMLRQRFDEKGFTVAKEALTKMLFQPQKETALEVLISHMKKLPHKELIQAVRSHEAEFNKLDQAQKLILAEALFDTLEQREYQSLPLFLRGVRAPVGYQPLPQE